MSIRTKQKRMGVSGTLWPEVGSGWNLKPVPVSVTAKR